MAERNIKRPRTCQVCEQKITTTSKGIKKHAEVCKILVYIKAQ